MKSFRPKSYSLLLSYALFALGSASSVASPVAQSDLSADAASFAGARNFTVESFNKKIVSQLSASMLSNVELNSLGRYFAADLIQHDPALQNGRRAMLEWIQSMREQSPARTLTVKHILADRDLVFVHSHISDTPANEMSGINRYDFYRLDRGIIVERWAVAAKAPTRSGSGNSAFSDLYKYSAPPGPLSEQRVEMNRLLVHHLSEEVFGRRNFGLVDRLWAVDYIQHNPYVANGRAALSAVLPYIAPPGSHYRVVRSMADGDLTLVCSHNVPAGGNPKDEFSGAAVCDIFRVADFELVEHWDVFQAVPPSSVNGNSMFSSLYRRKTSHP